MMAEENQAALPVCAQTKVIFPFKLLDADDLTKSKILRGQKKLILSCVEALIGGIIKKGNKQCLLDTHRLLHTRLIL